MHCSHPHITTPELLAIRWMFISNTLHIADITQNTGHSSAASFPTGPVIADPFISPFGLTICMTASLACLCSKAMNAPSNVPTVATLLALPSFPSLLGWILPDHFRQLVDSSPSMCTRVTTHHTSVVLKVQIHSIRSPPWLALPYHNSRHDLFSQLRLPLFDCSHHHITNTGSRKPIEACTNAFDGNYVKIACARVIAAIHDSATAEERVSQDQSVCIVRNR